MSEEEIAGLKELFKMMDVDGSGTITFEELKTGLQRVGASLKDSEVQEMMTAVRGGGAGVHCHVVGIPVPLSRTPLPPPLPLPPP